MKKSAVSKQATYIKAELVEKSLTLIFFMEGDAIQTRLTAFAIMPLNVTSPPATYVACATTRHWAAAHLWRASRFGEAVALTLTASRVLDDDAFVLHLQVSFGILETPLRCLAGLFAAILCQNYGC